MKNNKLIIFILFVIVGIMTLGFSLFSTNLNIKGTSSISSNWNVHISNVTIKETNGNASDEKEPTFDKLNANIYTNLVSPGDYEIYTITVTNSGSIDAVLRDIKITDSDNPAIIFETSGMDKDSLLLHGNSDTIDLKVMYNNSITSQPKNTSSNIIISLTFEQKTDKDMGTKNIEKLGNNVFQIEKNYSSKDGLYQDSIEENKYFYRGKNPKNFLKFNDELWRILSISTDGTIKIVKNDFYSTKFPWDPENKNDWSRPSYLNNDLNTKYYNSLNKNSKNMIKESSWNIGGHIYDNKHHFIDTDSNQMLEIDIQKEGNNTWFGNIALFTLTEYIRTNSNNSCLTLNNYKNDYSICRSNTWLYDPNYSQWTLSNHNIIEAWDIYSNGDLDYRYTNNLIAVRPALYLKSSVKITKGSGTALDPYQIQ